MAMHIPRIDATAAAVKGTGAKAISFLGEEDGKDGKLI